MINRSSSSMVSNPIICCFVTHWGSTTHGMRRPQHKKTVRTYRPLERGVLGFIAVEALLLQWSGAPGLVRTMLSGHSWLVVLAAFMGISWLAEKWARSGASVQMQYAGLVLYVVAEAVIFLPLLYIAAHFSSPNVIPTAGIVTALLFGGLTYIAFTTRRDFSFLGNILSL